MPLVAPTTLSVAVDGKIHRVPLSKADSLEDLKSRVQSAVGSPVAELRCARTGISIRTPDELQVPEDALIASREESSTFVDDAPRAPIVQLEVYAQAVAFNRLAPQIVVLGLAAALHGLQATAFHVAVSAQQAAQISPQSVGKRYVLHVGHRVMRPDEADAGGGLAAEWAMSTQKLGAHPNILLPVFYSAAPPPAEVLPHLPQAVRSALTALNGAQGGGHVQLLITESYTPLPKAQRQPLGTLFGYAVDLCRAITHARTCGVVHRGIRPDILLLPANNGRIMVSGWAHAAAAQSAEEARALAFPVSMASASSHAALLGPAPEWSAPEVHACTTGFAAGRPGVTHVAYDKADVWSAGALLSYLALGRHPWGATYPGGSAELLGPSGPLLALPGPSCSSAILADALRTCVPPALASLLLFMTRSDPSQRITARAALRRLLVLSVGSPTRPIPILLPPGALTAGPTAAHRFILPGLVVNTAAGGSAPSPMAEDDEAEAEEGEGQGEDGKEGEAKEENEEAAAGGGVLLLQIAEDTGGKSSLSPSPFATVPFSAKESDTVAQVLARAWEQLYSDGGARGSTLSASSLSLLWRGARVDPAAPLHRLPAPLRNSGRTGSVLLLAPGLSCTVPSIRAAGYGAAVLPPPPSHGPTLLYQGSQGIPAVPSDSAGLPAQIPAREKHVHLISPAGGALQPVQAPVPKPDSAAAVCSFSPTSKAYFIELCEGGAVAVSRGPWGCVSVQGVVVTLPATLGAPSAPVTSAGGTHTRYTYSVNITGLDTGAGVAVGFFEAGTFDASQHSFGRQSSGWAYSRSGKISSGSAAGWTAWADPFGVGDVITADLDCTSDKPTLRFLKNGILQGTAFSGTDLLARPDDRSSLAFVPGVTMGSDSGGACIRVALVPPEVREFDRARAHRRITVSEDATIVENTGKWATALMAHPGIMAGKMTWNVRLDAKHGAGVAVGVVDAGTFKWDTQNLGASQGSWCYSKTGKKGDGSGTFQSYGRSFTTGDTISVILDMDSKTLSFAINGENQGVAYTAAQGIGSCRLLPAVCLGSTEGDKLARAFILGPPTPVRRFNPTLLNPKVQICDAGSAVETREKWGTSFVEHAPIKGGRFSFAVTITSAGQGCGAGIGFAVADTSLFDPRVRNLGAFGGSWCYSKTGKFGGHPTTTVLFDAYGSPFKTGDTVTAEVDTLREEMRFYVNGKGMEVRRTEGIRSLALRPAIVLGSSEGGHYTKMTIAPPAVTRFNPWLVHKQMMLDSDDRRVSTEYKWCSAQSDHTGVQAGGVLRFAVRLDGDGGAAVGFVEASTFKVYSQNLGASPGTWAISKTGKVSAGDAEGFRAFSEKIQPGDTVGAEADLAEGIIRFWKNGILLGTAFTNVLQSAEADWMPRPLRPLTLVPSVCLGSNQGGKSSSAALVEFPIDWLK